MEKLELYDKFRNVPNEAKKNIEAGRLKGKTDINPMWRIKTLTEAFGACGFGWRYEITDKRLEKGAKDEISAFVDINLFVKVEDKWSEAIQGTGGSSFVANERNGLYTSDECFKMALTDAISVACKALGIGADVYWANDTINKSKYDNSEKPAPPQNIDKDLQQGLDAIKKCEDLASLKEVWKTFKNLQKDMNFTNAKNEKRDELSAKQQ